MPERKTIKIGVVGLSPTARDAQFEDMASEVESNVKDNLDDYMESLIEEE